MDLTDRQQSARRSCTAQRAGDPAPGVRTGAWIGFDLDGVLAESHHGMAQAMAIETGRPVDWRDWHRYDFFNHAGVSSERFLNLIVEHRVLEQAPPAPGAVACVAALRAAGARVAVVTARSFHPRAAAVTRDWLDEHGMAVDVVHITSHSGSKLEVLTAQGVVAYADDYDASIDALARAGLCSHLYLVDQPWNRHRTDLARIGSAAELAARVLPDLAGFCAQVDADAARRPGC